MVPEPWMDGLSQLQPLGAVSELLLAGISRAASLLQSTTRAGPPVVQVGAARRGEDPAAKVTAWPCG
jgi:hypothetical protein